MNELGVGRRRGRGPGLLLAHCASLDPDTPTARERLDKALGLELAHKLVFALRTGSPPRIRERRVA
jgi:hypothetical protein